MWTSVEATLVQCEEHNPHGDRTGALEAVNFLWQDLFPGARWLDWPERRFLPLGAFKILRD